MPDTHQDELPLPLDPPPPPPLEDPLPQNLDDEGEGPRNLDDEFEHVNLVVRHVIIFGHGHGLQRAIIDESQHRTPERLIMAQH